MLACVTLHQEEEIIFLYLFKVTKHLQLPLITLIISGIGVRKYALKITVLMDSFTYMKNEWI